MWAASHQPQTDELCLIDSGIKSLHDVPLHGQLQVLNLHCNHITRIVNLEGLHHLKHLDLSSNKIHEITGLDYLTNLRTLNLSCNLIQTVQGCEHLRSLVKLNLSYNEIVNISGLQVIDGTEYKLSQLELHGNNLMSLDHVTRCLHGATNLRQLVLSQGGAVNPCCHQPRYRETVMSKLPQLELLDGADSGGNVVSDHQVLADLPGLDHYIDYLVSSGNSDAAGVFTPKINAALDAFRQRDISDVTTTSDHEVISTDSQGVPETKTAGKAKLSEDHMTRLEKLENQMVNLLYSSREVMEESSTREDSSSTPPAGPPTVSRRPAERSRTQHPAKRDIDETEESEEEEQITLSEKTKTKNKKSGVKGPSAVKGSKVSRSSQQQQPRKSTTSKKGTEKLVVRGRSTSPGSRRRDGNHGNHGHGDKPTRPAAAVSMATDQAMRDNVEETYIQIMHELETERERRWKAEEATKKLIEHIKKLETKAREEEGLQDVAIQATSRLKHTITNERETAIRIRTENDLLKEKLESVTAQLQELQKSDEESREALRVAHQTSLTAEREQLKTHTHQTKKIQEATMKAAAGSREVEILQNNVKTLTGQLQQMHQLLATREQEHRKELQDRHALGSPELQNVIQKEIHRSEVQHSKEREQQNHKIQEMSKDYESLEDEFRMALSIETSRFQELQIVFEKTSEESAHNKQALLAAQLKDDKSTSIISELTSLVKEQKGRISELSRSKQEQNYESKERIQGLESHLEEARKRMVTLELLKQENMKLRAEKQAVESLIEGLRTEKRVWGEELAQQESGLAQDRGRMQAKIEALTSEVATAKKHLDHETDSVRIKAKMIEDQTESIRKLKEGLQERDVEVKKARNETLKIQNDLEQQLSAELMASQELQEKLDRARERKDQLKSELSELEDKLEDSKNSHNTLNRKWKEKSSLIGQLEQQVMAMKDSWETKEKKLIEERNKAVNAAGMAVDKLRSIDDAFRKQLDNKEDSYQRALEALENTKQQEVDIANKRVFDVEEELRILLRENESNKRNMEERMKKLTRAFSELQHDIS